jgi:hypothetical protein
MSLVSGPATHCLRLRVAMARNPTNPFRRSDNRYLFIFNLVFVGSIARSLARLHHDGTDTLSHSAEADFSIERVPRAATVRSVASK